MTNLAQVAKDETDLSSEAQEVRENIGGLGETVDKMASRQYGRAQEVPTDAVYETEGAIQRNPLKPQGYDRGPPTQSTQSFHHPAPARRH
ncbi:MAG TPA: hypothetical protein DCL72_13555 [Rhizobiales bacterium]|jgi:phage tail protein X|nr:hypothetical protein [Hyphomicrobiales bacterium]